MTQNDPPISLRKIKQEPVDEDDPPTYLRQIKQEPVDENEEPYYPSYTNSGDLSQTQQQQPDQSLQEPSQQGQSEIVCFVCKIKFTEQVVFSRHMLTHVKIEKESDEEMSEKEEEDEEFSTDYYDNYYNYWNQ